MRSKLLLLVLLSASHAITQFGTHEERNCMLEDHLCFDVSKDGRYSLGDHYMEGAFFSLSAHREAIPEHYKKWHVWHLALDPGEVEADITLQFLPGGQPSARKVTFHKNHTEPELAVKFWVMRGNQWTPLRFKYDDYIKLTTRTNNWTDFLSTGNLSKLMQLEEKTFAIQVSISSWNLHDHTNITVRTEEHFSLFASKRIQGVAGRSNSTGTVVMSSVIGVLAVAALVALVTYLMMRHRRTTFTTSTPHSDLNTFKSELTVQSKG